MRQLLAAFLLMSVVPLSAGLSTLATAGDKDTRAGSFTFESIDGAPLPLAAYKGRVMLIVNTASFCGYTKQYSALQALSQRYEARGLTVIGVPSNDFGGQEPKSEAEIKGFCQGIFGVTFPLAAKTVVIGSDAHPFYAWARQVLGADAAPRWNFHKYLVGRDGRLVTAFATRIEPDAPEVITAIERELAKPELAATQ
jgi:glutathione peroxidase